MTDVRDLGVERVDRARVDRAGVENNWRGLYFLFIFDSDD